MTVVYELQTPKPVAVLAAVIRQVPSVRAPAAPARVRSTRDSLSPGKQTATDYINATNIAATVQAIIDETQTLESTGYG